MRLLRSGAAVTLLGVEPDAEASSADELRELEAADVAAVVLRRAARGMVGGTTCQLR